MEEIRRNGTPKIRLPTAKRTLSSLVHTKTQAITETTRYMIAEINVLIQHYGYIFDREIIKTSDHGNYENFSKYRFWISQQYVNESK